MNKLYIAYGSNLNLEQMAQRCPTAKVVCASMLRNMRLVFRGGHASAVATVEPAKGRSVPILVWEITPADEASLDRYEGWPYLYGKKTMKIRVNGKSENAMVYIMNPGRPLGAPSCYYYSVILDGYHSAAFDPDLLRTAARESAGNVESVEVTENE